MRKLTLYILIVATAVSSCMNLNNTNPYAGGMNVLTIVPDYPDDFPSASKQGIVIAIKDRNLGNSYKIVTAENGNASVKLPNGSYSLNLSWKGDGVVYNGVADKVVLEGSDVTVNMYVLGSTSGDIVFKEIYFGGCQCYPEQGNYQIDKYAVLHNNTSDIQYLDGLCFGTVDPYNSVSTNPWINPEGEFDVIPGRVPVVQAVWQFKGDGDDFPLQPGEDAVLCIYGAIDHLSRYPQSVNLNKPDYFVCYNTNYFPNTLWHPAPGSNIRTDHILDCVIKSGIATAYTFSSISPAVIIFRTPADITIQEFVSDPANVIQKPGSGVDRVVAVPVKWVVDGVEVFNGAGSKKRLPSEVDAGNVPFSESFNAHAVLRKTDMTASEAFGYEVLEDTNNSSNDFVEIEKHTLNE